MYQPLMMAKTICSTPVQQNGQTNVNRFSLAYDMCMRQFHYSAEADQKMLPPCMADDTIREMQKNSLTKSCH